MLKRRGRRVGLPDVALSIRQPWAWAIIHGMPAKDIENRSRGFVKHLPADFRKRIAVHAAKGMTRAEYDEGAEVIRKICGSCPAPDELQRGGIIGSVDVVDVVSESGSLWFFGPRGLVLRKPRACKFIPAVGALGYFKWAKAKADIVPPPARWMLPAQMEAARAAKAGDPVDVAQLSLFEEAIQ